MAGAISAGIVSSPSLIGDDENTMDFMPSFLVAGGVVLLIVVTIAALKYCIGMYAVKRFFGLNSGPPPLTPKEVDVEAVNTAGTNTVSGKVNEQGGDKTWLESYNVPYQAFQGTKSQVIPLPMVV